MISMKKRLKSFDITVKKGLEKLRKKWENVIAEF